MKISAIKLVQALGKNDGISQYVARAFKGCKETNYMVEVAEAEEFLVRQELSKLKYSAEAKVLRASKEYLNFTEVVAIESTTKKGTAQKKGTISDLRKFLELKGLTTEFSEMLNSESWGE